MTDFNNPKKHNTMAQLTLDFKEEVATTLVNQRDNYGGSDADFSRQFGINASVYNRIKNGERDKLLSDIKWINLARELGVSTSQRKWVIVRTSVLEMIEEEILFCKEHSKGMNFVDDCGIGKTVAAQYVARTHKNCFYLDASQCKTKNEFIRTLSRVVGVGENGKIRELKANTKYYLKFLEKPVVIIDEWGDLDYNALLELKEFWNATDGVCGWYLVGADGAREKMERGKRGKKVGFAELFSRFSERYSRIVPLERTEKINFYKELITDVLSQNMSNKENLKSVVRQCITIDETGHIGGLRRAESLAILKDR